MHSADVTQTVSFIVETSKMAEVLDLSNLDIFAFIFSAIVHDFKHTGQNNGYHINKQTDLALMYNDISVLENYHISETFKFLNNKDLNIFNNYSKDEKKLLRKRIVDMILATDMSLHTKIYTSLKLKLEKMGIEQGENTEKLVKGIESNFMKFDAQQEILNYILHAADLSHNVKIFEITEVWTNLVMNEFWNQGDMEKDLGLPVSFNCDRLTANVPKGQIGFLNGFIIPTFQLLSHIFPSTHFYVENACDNLENWAKKFDDE
jgi:hypothetical protein